MEEKDLKPGRGLEAGPSSWASALPQPLGCGGSWSSGDAGESQAHCECVWELTLAWREPSEGASLIDTEHAQEPDLGRTGVSESASDSVGEVPILLQVGGRRAAAIASYPFQRTSLRHLPELLASSPPPVPPSFSLTPSLQAHPHLFPSPT